MSTPFRIGDDYKTSRDELRQALNGAVEKRRPPLGFILGLIGTLAIGVAAAAFFLGVFPGH